jgi:biopolymer transport protein ExbB/TolQ
MLVDILFRATLIGAGWVLYLLIGLSVVSIAIMIERCILLVRDRIDYHTLGKELKARLDHDDIDDAKKVLQGVRSPEARIVLTGLEEIDKGLGAVEEHVAAATNVEKARLERNLAFLGTVGSNAPFIGLFGTVLGIIRAFHDLSLGSQEGAAAVMAGISEALVATAVGLMVAIPAVVAFNVFKRQVAARLARADTLTRVLYAKLKG